MKKLKKWMSAFLIGALLSFHFALPTSTVHAEYASDSVQKNFIQTIAPHAVTIARANGLFPSIMIAQAILESDWGKSKLSQAPYYNLFGIKGGSDGVIFDTLEDDGFGNYYGIKDSFRRYNSYLESLEDYANLFRSTPYLTRLYADFVNARTIEEAARALTGTYATDTHYGDKLLNIIIGYNLLKFDGHVNRAPSWQIHEKNDIVYSLYDQVNIREDHSTDSEILGRAMTGQAFRRLGVTTGWTYIQLDDGRKAYIATQYVSTEKPDEEYSPSSAEGNGLGSKLSETDRILHLANKLKGILANTKDETIENKDNLNEAGDPSLDLAPQEPSATQTPVAPPEPTNPPEAIAPPEPENQGPTEAEIEAAKKAADAAIAEGPSEASQNGLLGSRTAGVENQNKVDKTKLEGLLGSDVDLPFASEEVKADYRQALQKAVSIYWNAKSTQADIDKIVETLNELRAKAEEEDAVGLKADQEKARELVAEGIPVKLQYTKLLIENPVRLFTNEMKFPFSKQTLESLRTRGQRWISFDVKLKEIESQKLIQPRAKVTLDLPVPEAFDPNLVEIYAVDPSYRVRRIPHQIVSDSARIQTNKITSYLILERNVELMKARKRNAVSAAAPEQLGLRIEPATKRLFGWEMIFAILLTVGVHASFVLLRKQNK